jgi:D-serine deaminase-like pyridoxal phosphate-dependent protein
MGSPTLDALRSTYLGQSLQEVPTPAAILDLAKLETNCLRMLEAARRIGVSFRAHVKTHKV